MAFYANFQNFINFLCKPLQKNCWTYLKGFHFISEDLKFIKFVIHNIK